MTLTALEQCKNDGFLYSGLVTMIDSHEEALIYALANNPEDLREEIREFWIGNLLFISKLNLNHKELDRKKNYLRTSERR